MRINTIYIVLVSIGVFRLYLVSNEKLVDVIEFDLDSKGKKQAKDYLKMYGLTKVIQWSKLAEVKDYFRYSFVVSNHWPKLSELEHSPLFTGEMLGQDKSPNQWSNL